jgi:malonate transporter
VQALATLVPVFFALGLGFYAGKRGRVDNRQPDALIAVLMQFALPCSLFLGVASAPPAVLRSQLPLLLLLALVMLATYGVMFWLARRVWHQSLGEAAVLALTVAFANNVAIGLPFLSSVEGAGGKLAVMSGIVAGALVVSPLTLVLLEFEVQSKGAITASRRSAVRRAITVSLRRPVILAPALALLVPLTGHVLPAMMAASLDVVGKATVGLALFLTGLILSAQSFQLSPATRLGLLLKNVLQPLLVFALLRVFLLHGPIAQQAVLLGCVPAGFFGSVFAARYRIASADAGSTLVLSTLLAAITLPLAVALAAHIP